MMPARRPAPSAGRCPSDRLTAKAAAAMAVFCSASRRRESDECRSTLRLIGKHCISITYRQVLLSWSSTFGSQQPPAVTVDMHGRALLWFRRSFRITHQLLLLQETGAWPGRAAARVCCCCSSSKCPTGCRGLCQQLLQTHLHVSFTITSCAVLSAADVAAAGRSSSALSSM